jgi:preprotein translocase subunit YajC
MQSQTLGTSPQTESSGNILSLLFPFILILGIMYIFLFLPQKRRDKQHRAMLSELKKNDHVVTAGGLHGIVMSVKEGAVVLKIDDAKDIKVTVNTGSIAQVMPRGEQESE